MCIHFRLNTIAQEEEEVELARQAHELAELARSQSAAVLEDMEAVLVEPEVQEEAPIVESTPEISVAEPETPEVSVVEPEISEPVVEEPLTPEVTIVESIPEEEAPVVEE